MRFGPYAGKLTLLRKMYCDIELFVFQRVSQFRDSPILSNDHISRLRNPDFLTQLTLDVSRFVDIDNFDCEELGSFEI